jgi:hypothetical protein
MVASIFQKKKSKINKIKQIQEEKGCSSICSLPLQKGYISQRPDQSIYLKNIPRIREKTQPPGFTDE